MIFAIRFLVVVAAIYVVLTAIAGSYAHAALGVASVLLSLNALRQERRK